MSAILVILLETSLAMECAFRKSGNEWRREKTPKPTTSAILIIRVAISRELDMWIVEIRIGCINIHLVRRFVTKICIEFELLSFYCTSSHNQTFEKSWTGFDEWHGIEVRIPNDGDSWDAKSEYFLRILPLFLQLNQSVFRQRPFKSLWLKIDSNFVTGISPSCLGLRANSFSRIFFLISNNGNWHENIACEPNNTQKVIPNERRWGKSSLPMPRINLNYFFMFWGCS